jgi:hypothetical protein
MREMTRDFRQQRKLRIGEKEDVMPGLDIWMVIQTDEVPREEVLAAGFEPVPAEMSDDEVRERYGVKEIYHVTDDRTKAVN